MTPDQLTELTAPFLQQGLLGVLNVAASWLAWYFYRSRESDRKEHKVELASKDKLISELYEKRIDEKEAITALAVSTQKTMEVYANAVKARVPS